MKSSLSARTTEIDWFTIEIALTHPTFDPQQITSVLSVEPTYSWKSGDQIGTSVKRATHWYGRLSAGPSPDEFSAELSAVLQMLTHSQAFFEKFAHGGGTGELILNHNVAQETEGKVLELRLGTLFLSQIASAGLGLRVQGWNRSPSAN